jgi:hypothetical protein
MRDGVWRKTRYALSAEKDVPIICPIQPADAVHQRGLPGAVDANNPQYLTWASRETDAVQCGKAAEPLD